MNCVIRYNEWTARKLFLLFDLFFFVVKEVMDHFHFEYLIRVQYCVLMNQRKFNFNFLWIVSSDLMLGCAWEFDFLLDFFLFVVKGSRDNFSWSIALVLNGYAMRMIKRNFNFNCIGDCVIRLELECLEKAEKSTIFWLIFFLFGKW